MSNIVFLSTLYLGKPSANGICARNIVDELVNMDHDVSVVCYMDSSQSHHHEKIYMIEKPESIVANSTATKIKRLCHAVMGKGRKLLNEKLISDYYDALCVINKERKIDAVVAMFFPMEAVEALKMFKQDNPDVCALIYEVDSIGDGVVDSGKYKIFNSALEKWQKQAYKAVDKVFVMKCHEEYWKEHFLPLNPGKMVVADFPVLKKPLQYGPNPDKGKAKLIYTGLIERRYRSPSYMLSVLEGLDKKIDFECVFYSKGDCDDEIKQYAARVKNMIHMGYIPKDELEEAIRDADFFINLGNMVSRSLPSKLVTYVSYGKPIIHFSYQKNDVCADYLKDYPYALIVDQSRPVQESVEKVADFVEKMCGRAVEYDIIKEQYKMNIPYSSAKLIDDIVGNFNREE